MANISFLVKGSGTNSEQNAAKAWVTIEEMNGGSLFFKVKQVGGVMGNLHGLYFDIADETILNSLRIRATSMHLRTDEDSMTGMKYGTDLTDSFAGQSTRSLDAKEIIREYTFTLQSEKRALALSDFSCMQLDYSDNRGDCTDATINDDDSHRWLYLALL
ncbi:hypothetical protein ABF87_03310 [Nitrosomonas sp. JL21]|uniref:hypothetical protein n=1 Tax=Nitrosomonas sp. JL21 TaxID=153949 RepID=UPI00136C43A4|nr:hypothetical protein [Nitrosomonas sp. JL21]MBL8496230.1 hypothetical protein [Nitrosomonas sp.]MXS77002.1 hypothetical protein [Nitrosomonas sp. JL21]